MLLAAPAVLAQSEILKPPHDQRAYQLLTLPNQLRVLLISDSEADKAAASLDVRVGYFDDPAERPGLAHFLEHMLFLGTEKYPHPAEYREFISAHGGRDNAYTSDQHTNFYFEVDQDHLTEALDHFSQFFVAPLFNEAYVAREMQAVDSEYRLKIKDDGRRLWQVQKATANPAHPFAKFSVGNSATLGSDNRQGLRRELITFYHEHYSANLMTLVVLGKEPLPALQSVVEQYFSAIPNQQLIPRPVEAPLFQAQQKATWINIEPVKDRRQLRLSFPFPWRQEYYLNKPTLLISHLLGHEGEGSLYQLLRRKGWVNNLNVSNDVVADNEATLDITLNLTESGLQFVSTITGLVFQYIELIRRQGIQPWIYAELRQINELAFRYRETPPPLNEVRGLASNLHHFPPALVLRGPYEFKSYEADFLQELLSRLVPENLRLTLMARGLPTSEVEPRYQIPDRITRLAPALLRRWAQSTPDPALAIPARNPFIPERAALKTVTTVAPVPQLIREEQGLRVWHKQDNEFHLPKADIFVTLSTALANDTPRHSILTRLYLMLVNDRLNALAYPASLAGLHYSISPGNGGILLALGGYDEKQAQLLDLLLDQMLALRIDPQRFAIKKDQLRKSWQNSRHDRPYLQLNRELTTILHHHSW
ncbi:MAG: insulinase family protein, partial [Gammaproteobacteria bacterium]